MSVSVPPMSGPMPMPPNMARFIVPMYFPSSPAGDRSAAYAIATGIAIADPIPCRNLKASRDVKSHAIMYRSETTAYPASPAMMTFFLLMVSLSLPAGAEKRNRDMLHALVSKPICVSVAPSDSAYRGMIGLTTPSPSIATNIASSSACRERSMIPQHQTRVYLSLYFGFLGCSKCLA